MITDHLQQLKNMYGFTDEQLETVKRLMARYATDCRYSRSTMEEALEIDRKFG